MRNLIDDDFDNLLLFKEMVMQIEHARKVFQSQKDKRARLLAQIEIDSQKIKDAHSKIDEINNTKNEF